MKLKPEKEKKESKLTPTMVDKTTKATIEQLSKDLGISQKEVVGSAVNLLVEMPNKIDTLVESLFGKKFKTKEDLKAVITNIMTAAAKPTEEKE